MVQCDEIASHAIHQFHRSTSHSKANIVPHLAIAHLHGNKTTFSGINDLFQFIFRKWEQRLWREEPDFNPFFAGVVHC